MKEKNSALLNSELLTALPELSDWQPMPLEFTLEVDARNANRMAALFNLDAITEGDPLPLLWHWAFFQEPAKQREIGIDGHPRKGGFLPPILLPRRMFAGSKLSFHRPLLVGETYQYSSSINGISVKQGKSGNLAFVRVEHRIADKDGNSCLNENQDIVYREASKASPHLTAAASNGDRNHDWDWEEKVVADPVMLFRYSAVTYNGHRIHYDFPYATQVEGYPGLVVHGPLLATLMTKAVGDRIPKARLAKFEFAGRSPVSGSDEFTVAVRRLADSNSVETAILSKGAIAMSGKAELE
ncbi:MAG: MaoC family dehydratase N-terminal domain-containing protein [Xanthobacteraceae bacterium]|nr:MaoC family dehydratase N-terminal domain-containing protein [Xanthobacteraceae bacterium]